MTRHRLGAALQLPDLDPLRDWLFEADRAIEIQDFATPNFRDTDARIAAWRAALSGHDGPRGIHGPFVGLDISNPDEDIRAIVTTRLLDGVAVAESLAADMMVVHSPFTYWHGFNRTKDAAERNAVMEASADCLAPVLARASDTGVTLVLENIEDTDPADRADLVALIGHTRLALSVDTGHADIAHAKAGGPPVVDVLAHAGERLAHVHLQDVDGHADRHWHPGEGRIAWQPVIDTLAVMTRTPRLILEVSGNLHRLPQTAAWLEAMADQH
jgi:sugar phosphate isomerase/epimerase